MLPRKAEAGDTLVVWEPVRKSNAHTNTRSGLGHTDVEAALARRNQAPHSQDCGSAFELCLVARNSGDESQETDRRFLKAAAK